MIGTSDLPLIPVLAEIGEGEAFMALLALIGLWVIVSNLRKMYQTRQQEKTRREIAAYVAEGSISATDGRQMMGTQETELEKKLTDAVSWGMISAKKAETLIKALRDDRESRERAAGNANA